MGSDPKGQELNAGKPGNGVALLDVRPAQPDQGKAYNQKLTGRLKSGVEYELEIGFTAGIGSGDNQVFVQITLPHGDDVIRYTVSEDFGGPFIKKDNGSGTAEKSSSWLRTYPREDAEHSVADHELILDIVGTRAVDIGRAIKADPKFATTDSSKLERLQHFLSSSFDAHIDVISLTR